MLAASSKLLPIDVDSCHHADVSRDHLNRDTSVSSSTPLKHQMHSIHQPRAPKIRTQSRKIPPKSPDLIELSDAGPSPISVYAFDRP